MLQPLNSGGVGAELATKIAIAEKAVMQAAPYEQAARAANAEAQYRANMLEAGIIAAGVLVVVLMLAFVIQRRRAVLKVADAAAIGALASGVKGFRKGAALAKRTRERVIDKANEG